MSADMGSIIADAIEGETEYPVSEHVQAQTRAVQRELRASATVEWGRQYDYAGDLRLTRTSSEDDAKELVRIHGGVVVSRLTFPWRVSS